MELPEVLTLLGPSSVLSHELAAERWGIALVLPVVRRVTVRASASRARAGGWHVRRLDLAAHEVMTKDGVRVTTPVRTLVDLAQVLPPPEAVAAADSALRLGLVEAVELQRVLLARRGRGCGRAHAVARLVDARAESVLESLLRVLLVLAGVPVPVLQAQICERDGTLVARVDLCWPHQRLVVEADGFAFHSDRAAYRRDRERLNALERLGWRVLRSTWEDVRSRPVHVVATVRACLALAP